MDDTHWLEADRAAFAAAWTVELAEVPEFSEATLHIVAGLLLPIVPAVLLYGAAAVILALSSVHALRK